MYPQIESVQVAMGTGIAFSFLWREISARHPVLKNSLILHSTSGSSFLTSVWIIQLLFKSLAFVLKNKS